MQDTFSHLEEIKKEWNGIITHYYQDSDIRNVSDFMGNGLALTQYKMKPDVNLKLYCNIYFMCETVINLNPEK